MAANGRHEQEHCREIHRASAGAGKFSQRISGRKTASAHVQRTYPGRTELILRKAPCEERKRMIRKIDRHKRLARLELPVADGIQTLYAGLEIFSKINLSAH